MGEEKKNTEHKKKEFHMLTINYVTFSTITFIYFTKLNFRKRYQFLECFKNPSNYYLSCYIFLNINYINVNAPQKDIMQDICLPLCDHIYSYAD